MPNSAISAMVDMSCMPELVKKGKTEAEAGVVTAEAQKIGAEASKERESYMKEYTSGVRELQTAVITGEKPDNVQDDEWKQICDTYRQAQLSTFSFSAMRAAGILTPYNTDKEIKAATPSI